MTPVTGRQVAGAIWVARANHCTSKSGKNGVKSPAAGFSFTSVPLDEAADSWFDRTMLLSTLSLGFLVLCIVVMTASASRD